MKPDGALKLRAADPDDLAVLSAFLQDAVIAINDVRWLREEKRFVFVANRFCWEDSERERPAEGNAIYERVHCGICFDHVTSVRQMGLDQGRKAQIIALLAIEAGEDFIELKFSAGVVIHLEVERILCHLQDLDEAWPTQWRPSHPLDDD